MPTTAEILKRLRSEPLRRAFTIDRKAVNTDARTANLAFASDKPIDSWFGRLKLTMSSKAMDPSRLKRGAPVLMDHNTSDVVGVVESHSLGADGLARATVRFGESNRAQEVFHDVASGIRQNVSVGFMVNDMKLESAAKETPDGVPVYRSDSWTPYEISIVAVPADISVGVGRSANLYQENFNKMETDNPSVLERRQEIVAFADIFGEGDLARTMVLASDAVTIDDVRTAIKAKHDAQPKFKVPPMDPQTHAAIYGGIELAHSIPRYGKLRNFTGEGAESRAYRFGSWLLAAPFGNEAARAFCQRNGIMLSRAGQSEGVNEKGGYLVPEEFGNDLVDLIEQHGVFRRNAKVVPMNSDTRSDPRITGRLTAAFVNESTSGTDQNATFDRINLTVKKVMITVPFSSEVMEDATINIGDMLAGEAARAVAEIEDKCGFIGDGTDTYGGMQGITTKIKGLSGTIANIAGLVVATGTGYASSYASIVLSDFEAVAAKLPVYADGGNAKWYCHKSFYWNVMVKLALASGGVTGAEIAAGAPARFLGYPVEFVQVMTPNPAVSQVCAVLGDLGLGASFGDRRRNVVTISDAPRFLQDDLTLKLTSRFDVNVHDVGNADSVAANRVPGPIVGLITAAS